MLKINSYNSRKEMGEAAGLLGATSIKEAIAKNGEANIILATGQSQFETIEALLQDKDIDWSKIRVFHLDEYIDLSENHPASFRKYLKERFLDKITAIQEAILINGENDVEAELKRISEKIAAYQIDVAFVGIGENGHLAFNDPPADFNTKQPYLRVDLDKECRLQQLGEGWFNSLDEVPKQAISMSVYQILQSAKIVCTVPDERKALAVKNCIEGEISNLHPASILQSHDDCHVFLDSHSASLLVDSKR
ncbi:MULTISPECIES: glucosamine-6-phosphate deaminase [Sphingobacterium]|uniref:glucosamine-6-phosphate deaminase n=1 Tax=Sphingobacterium TaxID=28453 RepID=UPI00257DC26F|nr:MULTISPECIES: glucosamine-6-phosphate deaminase [Sphingobacterium]